MKLFSFDKFWELTWQKLQGFNFEAKYKGYTIIANKAKVSSPEFKIYKGDEIKEDNLVASHLNSDLLIMQLKSIQETGKIAVK